MAAPTSDMAAVTEGLTSTPGTKGRATQALVADPTMEDSLRAPAAPVEDGAGAGAAAPPAAATAATAAAGEVEPRGSRALMPTTAFKQDARISRSPARGGSIGGPEGAHLQRLVEARMADKNIQQLRGIFAGFDQNSDNHLQHAELVNALLALGVKPTDSLLLEYFRAAANPDAVDLQTFIDVSMRVLADAATIFPEVHGVFAEKDAQSTGRVGVPTLRHLLQHVHTGTQLSEGETEDFLKMIGISDLLSQAKRAHGHKVQAGTLPPSAVAPSEGDFEVNYAALIDDMLFVDSGEAARAIAKKAPPAPPPRM